MNSQTQPTITARPDAARMSEVISLLRRRIRAFGKRPLTEQDFYSICKRRGVCVINEEKERELMESVGGFYTLVEGVPCIFLNAHEHGFIKQWVMFHELGHDLLHSGRLQTLCFGEEENYEIAQYEADAFAGICLLPNLSERLARKLEKRIDLFRQFNL